MTIAATMFVLGLLAAARLTFFSVYHEYRQLHEQLPTFADLQSIAIELQRQVEEKGEVQDEDARTALSRLFEDGRDIWGNKILFATRTSPKFSFILVSPGSDGRLDVDDLQLYFDSRPRDIIGQLERDIVFRDGVAVSNGGKR